MAPGVVDRVWAEVSERVGDDLRVVTRYDGGRFDTRMRDDVRRLYTAAEDQRVVDDTVVDQLRVRDVAERFRAGPLRAHVLVFEEAWILAWPSGSKSGVIVSLQRDGGTATAADVEWCIDYLAAELGPD